MSFILDALKKSEAERSRHNGPTLIDIRVASPRTKMPLWVIIIGLVLLANLIVLAAVLLRRDGGFRPNRRTHHCRAQTHCCLTRTHTARRFAALFRRAHQAG
jgi:hypothetical protein